MGCSSAGRKQHYHNHEANNHNKVKNTWLKTLTAEISFNESDDTLLKNTNNFRVYNKFLNTPTAGTHTIIYMANNKIKSANKCE